MSDGSANLNLITGADGLIGRHIAQALGRAAAPVLLTTRNGRSGSRKLELGQPLPDWLDREPIAVAYLCAWITSSPHCRREPARTNAVNVAGTIDLARRLLERGTFVVFFSSNLVFDGSAPFVKADAPLCPCTEYGRQKAQAEQMLRELGPNLGIVRFGKVMSTQTPLLAQWRQSLLAKRGISAISDMVVSPITAEFAAKIAVAVGNARLSGIVQASASKDLTYAQIAQHMARRLGADPNLVQARRTADSGLDLEHLPRHTTLDTSALSMKLGLAAPDPWDAVDRAVAAAPKDAASEVMTHDQSILRVGQRDVEKLKAAAPSSTRRRVRLCAHRGNQDKLHEMVIALDRHTYVRPHKHPDKSESVHVIEGRASAVVFDDEGHITQVIRLGPSDSDRDFYYRMAAPFFHTLVIESDVLIVHETTNGPFDPSQTVFAPWAPDESDPAACEAYVDQIRRSIQSNLDLAKT